MNISIKIHDTDLTAQTCIVTVKDGSTVVLNKKNTGVELNPDGTANTDYIIYKAKERILLKRERLITANSVIVAGHPLTTIYTGE